METQHSNQNLTNKNTKPKLKWITLLLVCLGLFLFSLCLYKFLLNPSSDELKIAQQEVEDRRAPSPDKPIDTALVLLNPIELALIPTASSWKHPLGSPNGAFTYNAQPFFTTQHLGDDLNGISGWNSDLGDPVYSAAKGRVIYSGDAELGWGNMVILAHRLPQNQGGHLIQSVYAHLDTIISQVGDTVELGEKIGTVGTADGQYFAHLHFEMRTGVSPHPGIGYGVNKIGRFSPQQWINKHSSDKTINSPTIMKKRDTAPALRFNEDDPNEPSPSSS